MIRPTRPASSSRPSRSSILAAFLAMAGAVPAALAGLAACDSASGDVEPSTFDASSGKDAAADSGPVVFADGGGSVIQIPDGSPEQQCQQALSSASCRQCCEDVSPGGRRVFTDSQLNCVCQPSKCLDVCKTTYCALPTVITGVPKECTACLSRETRVFDGGAEATTDATVTLDGGYVELGVEACGAFASNACRASEECIRVERCKAAAACSSKGTDGG